MGNTNGLPVFGNRPKDATQGNTQDNHKLENDASVTGNKYICSNGHAHSSKEELEFCSKDRHEFMEKGIERHKLDLENIAQQRLHDEKMLDKRIECAKVLSGQERERQLMTVNEDIRNEGLNEGDTVSTEEPVGQERERQLKILNEDMEGLIEGNTVSTEENVGPSDPEKKSPIIELKD